MSIERSSPTSITDTLHQRSRNELEPNTRDYADSLHSVVVQTLTELKVADIDEFAEAVRTNHLSPEQLNYLQPSLALLKETIEQDKIPFNEEEFNGAVQLIAQEWIKYRKEYALVASKEIQGIRDDEIAFLKERLDTLPLIPAQLLRSDPKLSQRTLVQLYAAAHFDSSSTFTDLTHRSYVGLPLSLILNRSLTAADPRLRRKIKQEVDLKGMSGINFLGFRLPAGHFITHGSAGEYLGYEMQGGEMIAEKAGNFLGYKMKGGAIKIIEAGEHIGDNMTGGEIHISGKSGEVSKSRKDGQVFYKGKKIS